MGFLCEHGVRGIWDFVTRFRVIWVLEFRGLGFLWIWTGFGWFCDILGCVLGWGLGCGFGLGWVRVLSLDFGIGVLRAGFVVFVWLVFVGFVAWGLGWLVLRFVIPRGLANFMRWACFYFICLLDLWLDALVRG